MGQVACAAIVALIAGLVAGCGAHASEGAVHPAPSSHARSGGHGPRDYAVCTELFCTGPGHMKAEPAKMIPSGDGSLYVTRITWHGWGTGTAVGTGTAHADDCEPNCAQGTYREYPATIMLTSPRMWRGEMAYRREMVSVPAIHDRLTFSIGLLPGQSSPPAVT